MRRIYPRSVYWYARYRWSWFLKIVARERRHTFRCQGLIKYPEEYFVLAHRPRQALFFTHFAKAMRIAKARDEGQDPISTIADPEPLEIADIRKDEEDYQEGDDEVPEEEEGQGETREEEQASAQDLTAEEQAFQQPNEISSRAAPDNSVKQGSENQEMMNDQRGVGHKGRTRWVILLVAALIIVAIIVGWVIWRNRFVS